MKQKAQIHDDWCCRLYSSAHYNDTFPKHTPPEILNTPLEGVVLLLKAMAVDKVSLTGLQHLSCCLYTQKQKARTQVPISLAFLSMCLV